MKLSPMTWLTLFVLGSSLPAIAQESLIDDEPKIQIFVSGLYNAQTFSITDQRSIPLYQETGQFNGEWTNATGPAFGFGATYSLMGKLAVGASFEMLNASSSESFRASLPHPFFFDSDRMVDGEESALSYDEKAINFLVGYTGSSGKILLSAYGGPSYFWTRTELIDDFTYSEDYPFDEASLDALQTRAYDSNQFGFNLGGWVGYQLLKQLAVGADVRYTWAKPKFTTSAGNEIELTAGGVRLGAGVRFLF